MFGRKNSPAPQVAANTVPAPDIAMLGNELMTMPFPALRDLKQRVDAAIAARTEEARASFSAQLAMFGLSLDDVKPVKKKRAARIKYRDPDNPENVWSGIGKRKKWLQHYLDAGRSIEEFAIE